MKELFKDMREAEELLVKDYKDFLMILDYLGDNEVRKPSNKMARFANAISNFCVQIIHDYLRREYEDTGKAD